VPTSTRRGDSPISSAILATSDPVRWLFEFLNHPAMHRIDEDERRLLGWEAFVFAYQKPGDRALAAKLRQAARVGRFAESPIGADLPAIHVEIRRAVTSLLDSGGSLTKMKGLHGVQRDARGHYEFVTGGDHPTEFLGRAFRLVAQLGRRVRRCAAEGCEKFFAAYRRQLFCSPACSQRTRTTRYNARHPGRAADIRRISYERRTKARLGPGTKVGERGQRPRS
jgi:hypothetical protein